MLAMNRAQVTTTTTGKQDPIHAFPRVRQVGALRQAAEGSRGNPLVTDAKKWKTRPDNKIW